MLIFLLAVGSRYELGSRARLFSHQKEGFNVLNPTYDLSSYGQLSTTVSNWRNNCRMCPALVHYTAHACILNCMLIIYNYNSTVQFINNLKALCRQLHNECSSLLAQPWLPLTAVSASNPASGQLWYIKNFTQSYKIIFTYVISV